MRKLKERKKVINNPLFKVLTLNTNLWVKNYLFVVAKDVCVCVGVGVGVGVGVSLSVGVSVWVRREI